jgi:small subunit ribosomal protein S16
MLAIRLQRHGRKGLAQYRIVVQESRYTPTSGKVVAYLGTYNPHTKAITVDTEKATTFLNNGAQPTSRIIELLAAKGVVMPAWVKKKMSKTSKVKNADKLRKNQPKEEAVEEPVVEAAPEVVAEESAEASEEVKAPVVETETPTAA